MPVARPNFSQILPRHAVQTVKTVAVIASGQQKFVERGPIVSPIEIEAHALPKLRFLDFPPPPFVNNVLIAGKNGLEPENHWPIFVESSPLDERCGKALGCRQTVIIADQNNIRRTDCGLDLLAIEHGFVSFESLVEFAEIFAAIVRILRPDFPLHTLERLQLRRNATGS